MVIYIDIDVVPCRRSKTFPLIKFLFCIETLNTRRLSGVGGGRLRAKLRSVLTSRGRAGPAGWWRWRWRWCAAVWVTSPSLPQYTLCMSTSLSRCVQCSQSNNKAKTFRQNTAQVEIFSNIAVTDQLCLIITTSSVILDMTCVTSQPNTKHI